MYTFCSEFCILVSNINFVGISYFLKIGGNNSDVAAPDLFSSDHISTTGNTLVNVYVALTVFRHIAGTS